MQSLNAVDLASLETEINQHLKNEIPGKMKRFALVTPAIVLVAATTFSGPAPARAHDMAAMGDMDAAPNGMSGHMEMSAHMVMTPSRPQSPQHVKRARDVLATLRRALARYRDSRVALSEGYQIFLPTIPQEVYHFTFYPAAAQEYAGHFNPARPGSLLYGKNSRGEYVLVGAMYSAPPEYTLDQLDEMIPLSVAHWHAHVNICLPNGITLNDLLRGDVGTSQVDMPGMIPVASNPAAAQINQRLGFLADGRFGFHGKIADAAACESAGGHFIPQAFGWMVHVYPFNGADLKVAFGTSVPPPPAN
jgi:hypothetical protein